MPTLRLPTTLLRATRNPAPSFLNHTHRRTLTTTVAHRYPAKDTQDKDSLQPKSTEYSKSGGDDAAAHEEGAFDPNSTRPEDQKAKSESGPGGESDSALNVSPGNPEVSKPRDPQEGGAQRSESESQGQKKSSGAGSGKKAGGAKSG